ncbi:MAG: polyprenyl synthetase family protein [Tannerellaceae bacterium]|jgi:geranylgeranyl diphosphate synthase type II|nr:polyprenyl synthetase family protein [Tannerellaceae bacterium]
MFSLNEILERVENEISQLRFNKSPNSLYTPISYILSIGGKRIRPALTLIACNIYSNTIEASIAPALCLEVFHNFTLLHDDLMDQADKRRNKPTVHKIWNENTAILSGDAMLIASYQLIAGCHPSYLKEALDLFTTTALDICGGQHYDMEFESRTDVTEAEYMEMIRLKTAVLLACSLKIGAIAGGASREDAEHLYQYGLYTGLAFQLQDDLLDVYGDTDTFGKNIGGDILCNKKTFLLVHALAHASTEQKEEMYRWFGQKTFDPSLKIATFKRIYNDLGVKDITTHRIEDLYTKALCHLKQLNVPEKRLEILKEAGNLLLYRKS